MNQFSNVRIKGSWLANMYFQLVVDIDKVIVYMMNYVNEFELKLRVEMNRMIENINDKEYPSELTTKGCSKQYYYNY